MRDSPVFVASRLYVLWRGLWGLSMIFIGVGQSYMYDGLGGLLSNSRKPRVMNKHQISLDVVFTLCDNPIWRNHVQQPVLYVFVGPALDVVNSRNSCVAIPAIEVSIKRKTYTATVIHTSSADNLSPLSYTISLLARSRS